MQEYDLRVDAEKRFLEHGWMAIDGEYRRRPFVGMWTTIAPISRHLFEIIVELDDEFKNKTLVRRLRRCQNLREAKALAWVYVEPYLLARHEKRQPVMSEPFQPQKRISVRSDRYAAKHKASRRPADRTAPSARL